MLYKLVLASLAYYVYGRSSDTLKAEDYPSTTETLPTACNELEDGYHWIRPIADTEDEYPNIYVYCNEGYTILNPSLFDIYNYHHPKAYFTTYSEYVQLIYLYN